MAIHDFFGNQLVQIMLAVLIAVVFQGAGHSVIERIIRRIVRADSYETPLDERKREDTLITVFRAIYGILVWVTVFFVILSILDVKLAPLITGAGLFGVIFGLGAQNAIKDYLAGIYILTENQYRVGDIISLTGGSTGTPGASGVVEEITLRITKLRGLDGVLHIVRNGEASIISNRTFNYSNVVVPLTLEAESDIDEVEKVVNRIGGELLAEPKFKDRIIEPMHFLRVDDFTDIGVVILCTGRVIPGEQWNVASEFRRRLLKAFNKHDIELSVAHRVITEEKVERPASRHKKD